MKKSILAACVAASLWGCSSPDTKASAAVEPKAEAPKVVGAARGQAPSGSQSPRSGSQSPLAHDAGGFVARAPEPAPEPTLGLAHELPGIDHLARARSLRETGDLSGALTEARRALYSQPDDEEALLFVARVGPIVGQHRLAADAWAGLSELKIDDASPRIQEARARLKARDPVGATVAALDAIERDPGNPEAHHAHGRAALARNELQEAIDAFEKVVALDPEHGHALNNLGFAYLRANENAAAVQVLERAAQALPNVAWVHNNLGLALERVGRTEEAKSAYLTATTLSPKYVKARVNMNRVAKTQVPVEPVDTTESGTAEE